MKIHEYPNESLTFQDADYYDIDFWNGSAFETKKILGSTIKSGILAGLTIEASPINGSSNPVSSGGVYNSLLLKEDSLPSMVGNSLKVLRVNASETAKEWAVISSGLTVGSTAITSGTVGRVLFEGAGNVVQEDSLLFWDNTNKRLGIGATPDTATRLDIRAQGALSTDIALRVRNSADSGNHFEVRGDGRSVFGNSGGIYVQADGDFQLNGLYGYKGLLGKLQHDVYFDYSGATNSKVFATNLNQNVRFQANAGLETSGGLLLNYAKAIVQLGGLNTAFTGECQLIIENNTSPSASIANAFIQYSADIVAGNAAPHFRTENGAIVKLYQASNTTAIDDLLINTGLLATGATVVPITKDLQPNGRLLLPMGELSYFDTTGTAIAITAISNGSTNMVKVNPVTSLVNDMDFSDGGAADGRLMYTGTKTRVFHCAVTLSINPAASNDTFVVGVAVNGAVVSSCKVIQKCGTSTDTQAFAFHCMETLNTGDYLEIYIGNMTSTSDITVKTLNMFALGM